VVDLKNLGKGPSLHVAALGQKGMMALAKALVGFCFFGIGFDKELVMIDCRDKSVVISVAQSFSLL
jgi:hypothetical protein